MNFACPQCAARNETNIPEPFLRCAFCQSTLYVDLAAITPVFTIASQIESRQVGLYLRKDFERVGFQEPLAIKGVDTVYFPFWEMRPERLERGSFIFPLPRTTLPAGTRMYFQGPDMEMKTCIPIDTQPETEGKRILYYLPFFRAEVEYRENRYPFFVSAVNGDVFGEPLPVWTIDRANRYLPRFLLMLAVFLLVNIGLDRFLPAVLSNLFFLAVFILWATNARNPEKKRQMKKWKKPTN